MSVNVTGVTASSTTILVVEVSDPSEAATHAPADWSVTLDPASFGQSVVVIAVDFDDDDNAILTVHPEMSPGATYIVELDGDSDSVVIDTGYATAPTDPDTSVGKIPVSLLLSVAGRQLQRIAGTGAAKLKTSWIPGDTRLVLTSTLAMPAEGGEVFVASNRFTYTSKTNGSLEGVVSVNELVEPIGAGALVVLNDSSRKPTNLGETEMELRYPWDPSQLRQAVQDTLLTHAEGRRFDSLVADYGYRRPYYITRKAWRRACLSAVWGKGCAFGCFFEFLEGALSQYSTTFDASISPSNPQRLTATSSTFIANHIGRLVRLPDVGLFRIASRTSATVVELLAFGTAYWDKADWVELGIESTLQLSGCEILPFVVHEPTPTWEETGLVSANAITAGEPALARVYIFSDTTSSTPPTYLQSDASARPVGQPYGGQLQADAAEVGDPLNNGPHPLYLIGTKIFPELRSVVERMLMPPGFRLEIRRHPLS